ncbi:MAG TPA: phosphatase PAP2 family protein [Thermoanaerobaculia bacterium]
MSNARKRRYAAAAFIALLLLSVLWPSPVVSSNRLWLNEPLAVDELSFLGREAPSWDVVFWCLAGLFALLIVQSGAESLDFGEAVRQVRAVRMRFTRGHALLLVMGALLVAFIWLYVDARVLAFAELIQSERTEDAARLANRLGGGMNPAMLVFFFLLAGVAYREKRWVSYAVAMAFAGLGAGVLAQLVKAVVARARPELWLGPFQYAPGSATSFPSGHTVGAFALAGVLVFASPSWPLRIVAFLLAASVGASRVLAFRHWTSDVTASAILGLLAAALFTRAVTRVTHDPPAAP